MSFERRASETDLEYIYRICEMKDTIGTWSQVANIINEHLGTNYDESCFRKKYQSYQSLHNGINEDRINQVDREHIGELLEEQKRLYKQQIKTRDALREYRNGLRDDARIEVLEAAIREDSEKYNPVFRPYVGRILPQSKEAILCIGDWHCGDEVHNFYNDFDLEILTERVQQLADDTIRYCQDNQVTTLNVVNLSDLIEGQIHVTCRVQNELDVIQQIKCVSRLLCGLLIQLSNNIEKITYRSVLDNHSRTIPNYKEHIEKESFAKLIDWWLQAKLESYNERSDNKIKMCFDNIDDNIGYLQINGKNIFFSHGHLDSPATVIQDYSFATGKMADMVLLGHWHTQKVEDFQGSKIFLNGSLKGVDQYALNKRKFGKPSQTLLIFDNNNIINIAMQF